MTRRPPWNLERDRRGRVRVRNLAPRANAGRVRRRRETLAVALLLLACAGAVALLFLLPPESAPFAALAGVVAGACAARIVEP